MASIAVESNRKTIQHLEGGIVREILVRDGDVVHQGDTLLRLDPTRNAATDKGFRQQLAIASALQARLMAQRDMADTIDFPPEVTAFMDDPLIVNAIHDNQSQFDNRRESLLRGSEVIEKQIAQAKDEIRQADLDEKTAQQQIDSIDIELPNLRMLLEKGLVALPRVTTLERQLIQTQGQLDGAKISKTKATEKVAELPGPHRSAQAGLSPGSRQRASRRPQDDQRRQAAADLSPAMPCSGSRSRRR